MKEEVSEFWDWFVINNERLNQFDSNNVDAILLEIQNKLNFIGEGKEYGVALEISKLNDGRTRLEISADGIEDLFDDIILLVDDSPSFQNWEIIAFRQPVATPFKLEFGNLVFNSDELVFAPYNNEGRLHIDVYGNGFNNCESQNYLYHYGLTFIDNLIGEYNCVKLIDSYDFTDISNKTESKTYPIHSLQDFLDYYYSKDN